MLIVGLEFWAVIVDSIGVVGNRVADEAAEFGQFLRGPLEFVCWIEPLRFVLKDRIEFPIVTVTTFVVLVVVEWWIGNPIRSDTEQTIIKMCKLKGSFLSFTDVAVAYTGFFWDIV